MTPLLKEFRHNALLWMLALVPVVLAAQLLKPEAHTLSVCALRPGHRAIGDGAQPSHRVRGGQDGRHDDKTNGHSASLDSA